MPARSLSSKTPRQLRGTSHRFNSRLSEELGDHWGESGEAQVAAVTPPKDLGLDGL